MADPEIKELLEKNLKASQESLKILKKMNRARLFGSFFSIMKWVVIIGISFGSYYYIEPYLVSTLDSLDKITSGLDQARDTAQQIESAPSDLLQKIQGLMQ